MFYFIVIIPGENKPVGEFQVSNSFSVLLVVF